MAYVVMALQPSDEPDQPHRLEARDPRYDIRHWRFIEVHHHEDHEVRHVPAVSEKSLVLCAHRVTFVF